MRKQLFSVSRSQENQLHQDHKKIKVVIMSNVEITRKLSCDDKKTSYVEIMIIRSWENKLLLRESWSRENKSLLQESWSRENKSRDNEKVMITGK